MLIIEIKSTFQKMAESLNFVPSQAQRNAVAEMYQKHEADLNSRVPEINELEHSIRELKWYIRGGRGEEEAATAATLLPLYERKLVDTREYREWYYSSPLSPYFRWHTPL